MKENEKSIVEISINEAHNIILALSNKTLEIKSIFVTIVFAFLGVSFFRSDNVEIDNITKWILVVLLFAITFLFLLYYLRTSYYSNKWRLIHDKRVDILLSEQYENPFSQNFYNKVSRCDVFSIVGKKSKFSIFFFFLLFVVCCIIVFWCYK